MTTCFCYGCGTIKDPDVEEMYTGEDLCNDNPIPPLMVLDCEPSDADVYDAIGIYGPDWKTVVVCFECFDRLQPDMWISQNCWERLNPFIPFRDLPNLCGAEVDWSIQAIEERRLEELENINK